MESYWEASKKRDEQNRANLEERLDRVAKALSVAFLTEGFEVAPLESGTIIPSLERRLVFNHTATNVKVRVNVKRYTHDRHIVADAALVATVATTDWAWGDGVGRVRGTKADPDFMGERAKLVVQEAIAKAKREAERRVRSDQQTKAKRASCAIAKRLTPRVASWSGVDIEGIVDANRVRVRMDLNMTEEQARAFIEANATLFKRIEDEDEATLARHAETVCVAMTEEAPASDAGIEAVACEEEE